MHLNELQSTCPNSVRFGISQRGGTLISILATLIFAAQHSASPNWVQQCYPFVVAKPSDKPLADKAQLDVSCNHRYPDFNLPSGDWLPPINSLERLWEAVSVFIVGKSACFCCLQGRRLAFKLSRKTNTLFFRERWFSDPSQLYFCLCWNAARDENEW